MFRKEQFQQITEEVFLKHHFDLPVSFVMVGVNGVFFTGRWEVSEQMQFKNIILSGEARKLGFPINMILVDRTGKAAHVLFKKPDGPIDLTNLQVGQA